MDKDCQLLDCTLCPLYTAIMTVIDKDIIVPSAPENVEQYELTRIKLDNAYKDLAMDVIITKEQFLAGMLEGKEIDGKPAMCNFFNLYTDWLNLLYNIIAFTQPAMRDYNFAVIYAQDTNEIILLPSEEELKEQLDENE